MQTDNSQMVITISTSVGDGSCFFDSIAQILRSAGQAATIETVRKLVASTVLDVDDDAATATMLQWRELVYGALKERDAALIEEFGHASVLLDAAYIADARRRDAAAAPPETTPPAPSQPLQPLQPLTISDECRQRLYDVMMTPRYQGEEYALRVLETKLGVRCRVYQTSSSSSRHGGGGGHWHHCVGDSGGGGGSSSDQTPPTPRFVCALLHTDGRHYEPIAFDGAFLFHYREPATTAPN